MPSEESIDIPETDIVLGGRMLDIASGRTDLPPDVVALYRERWASQGYVLPAWQPKRNGQIVNHGRQRTLIRKPSTCGSCGNNLLANGFGPGSQLIKAYSQAGVPHCQACLELAAQMDGWGVEGCRQRLDEIVNNILPRAKSWLVENRPWVQRMLSGVGAEEAAIRFKLKQDVNAAIESARKHADSIPGLQRGRVGFRARDWSSALRPAGGLPRFVTNEQFAKDTRALIAKLPPDITTVAGVARSGLYPATMIAMMLHVPLIVIRHHQADWFPAGNGWRLNEGAPRHQGTILVVDDTTMTGNSLKRTKHVISKMEGKKLFAAVYVNPAAKAKPDIWAVDLPWPHLLQWNLFNSVMMDSSAFDFDGVLCRDCTPPEDDDGPRYEKFLREAQPLHVVRKRRIKLIVTSRLEKYRPQTMDWLQKWGIRVDKMIMGHWGSLSERRADDVAAFKARHLRQWFRARARVKPKIYVESDARQAKRIAALSGGLVVCPNGQCFRGNRR